MKYCTDCGQKLKLLEDGCFKKKYQYSNCNNKVSEKQEWLKTVGVAGSVLYQGKRKKKRRTIC